MKHHTPGPWILNNEESIALITSEKDDKYICNVQIHQQPRMMGIHEEAEREANARLIASAPELLEALKLTVRLAEFGIDVCANNSRPEEREKHKADLMSWIDKANAAIKKATK